MNDLDLFQPLEQDIDGDISDSKTEESDKSELPEENLNGGNTSETMK